MTRFSYTLALRLMAPFIWIWMALRARRSGGEWGILSAARFGRYKSAGDHFAPDPVWIHAVSLGETRAAQPLVQALLDADLPILLTHTTATGRAEAARLFAQAIARGQLRQTWLPYDFPGAVSGFLEYFMPCCGVLIEREVWPNLIREAGRKGVPMALVSARLSKASLQRSRWASRALKSAYRTLDAVLAQTEDDAQRLKLAGAYAPRVVGNLKFDVSLPPDQLETGRAWRRSAGRPVVAIASTREGEDALFIDRLAAARKGDVRGRPEGGSTAGVPATEQSGAALHMLIPRHPQRFDEAAALLRNSGLSFVRRSADKLRPPADVDVLLGDSLGEMAFYYAASDVAIVAGGFAPLGGQNLIEACAAGTPVIIGPHMFNFAQAAQDAVAAGAAIQVNDAPEALRVAWDLVQDAPKREAMRAAGQAWTAEHAGAAQRIIQALQPWLVGVKRLPKGKLAPPA